MMLVVTLSEKLSMVIQQLLVTIFLVDLLYHTHTLLLDGETNCYHTIMKLLSMIFLVTHSPIAITICLGLMVDNLIGLMT